MRTIGSYEAKTHLPRLLDEVAGGSSFMITKHGHPVAQLTPVVEPQMSGPELVEAFKEARKGVRLNGLSIRDMIEEGHRY